MAGNEKTPKTISVDVEKIHFDLKNPRFSELRDQRDALHSFCLDRHARKTVNLAEHIADSGLNPSELLLVIADDRRGHYIALEGNRRLAAMKLLSVPARVKETPLTKPFQARIRRAAADGLDPSRRRIQCVLMLSRDEANEWISLKHTGENEGIGVVQWDGEETARFRGSDPGFKLLDYVRSNVELSEDAKEKMSRFSVTNLDRLLGDPNFRDSIGIDLKKGSVFFTHEKNEVLSALKVIIEDIATKRIKVSDIKLKEDRERYLDRISGNLPRGPRLVEPIDLDGRTVKDVAKPEVNDDLKPATKTRPQKSPLERKTVIPRSCHFNVYVSKVAEVVKELRTLAADQFPIAATGLLRTLIDTTTLEYIERLKISVERNRHGQPDLKDRIRKSISDFKSKTGQSEAGKAAENALLTANGAVYIDSLHLGLHGRVVHPRADTLRIGWAEIEKYIIGMWEILNGLENMKE